MSDDSNVVKVNMSDKARKAILQYLDVNGQVRAAKLVREVKKQLFAAIEIKCSDKTLYGYLADLVKEKHVIKNEVRRYYILYSKPSWVEYQNEVVKYTNNHARAIQKKLEKIQPVLAAKDDQGITIDAVENIDILHNIFMDIMFMHNWATLAKLRKPKEDSLAVDGILNGTVPDLLKLFSKAIGKVGNHRLGVIEALLRAQRAVVEGGHDVYAEEVKREIKKIRHKIESKNKKKQPFLDQKRAKN